MSNSYFEAMEDESESKPISGQITVPTAGTAVEGPDVSGSSFFLSPHPANTGAYVWVGNDGSGDVSSDNGFPIIAGGLLIEVRVSNLNKLWFDVQTSGDKVCWIKSS